MILDPDDITESHKQAPPLGLQNKRDLLLYGVNIEYIAGLPIRAVRSAEHEPGRRNYGRNPARAMAA